MKRLAIETIVCVACILGCIALGWRIGTDQARAEHLTVMADMVQQAQAATDKADQDRKDLEAKHRQDMADLDAAHFKKRETEIASTNNLVADLRAGTVRLRKSLAAAETRALTAGATGNTTGLGDAARGTGLQQADAEFLLREAGRADQVVIQLGACQAIVEADRAGQQ